MRRHLYQVTRRQKKSPISEVDDKNRKSMAVMAVIIHKLAAKAEMCYILIGGLSDARYQK